MKRTCKACAKDGKKFEADTLGEIKRHYAEMGHPTKSRKRAVEPEPEPETDPESSLLADALSAFLTHDTVSPSGCQRVIDYLRERFGTPQPIAVPWQRNPEAINADRA